MSTREKRTTPRQGDHDWTLMRPDAIHAFPTRRRLLPWQAKSLTYTATGYGPRIPSTRQAFIAGRWRRIYVAIYSNSGTMYVIVNKVRRIVREYQLQETQAMKAYNRETGARIIGTLETIPGTALTSEYTRKPDGSLEFEYDGETDVDWNGQTTDTDKDGKTLYVDENGETLTDAEIVLAGEPGAPEEED